MEGNEGKAPTPLTSRTAATPAPDSKSDRVRLPTPSEMDSSFLDRLIEANEELLAEKRAKEAAKKGKYPTAAALVMARMMKRVAAKYGDLGLARRAKYLEKDALSALKNGQSALSNPREINCGEGPSTTKSEKRVIAGPSRIDGGVSRIVEFADGSGRIESWKPGVGWVGQGGCPARRWQHASPLGGSAGVSDDEVDRRRVISGLVLALFQPAASAHPVRCLGARHGKSGNSDFQE
jgi:hypothetical protein